MFRSGLSVKRLEDVILITMLKTTCLRPRSSSVSACWPSAQAPRRVALGDWPEARGPNRDGISRETGLVEKWALNGENFLWRAPYGGRSAPIVMGNRVCVQNPAGSGARCRNG